MQHGQMVHYGTFDSSELSRRTVLETRKSGHTEYELGFHTVGYECAGSMARWSDHECYSVLFEMGGATHGRRFFTLEEAKAILDKWAPLEVAA